MTVELMLDRLANTATVVFDGLPLYAMTSRGTFRNYWDPDPAVLLGAMLVDAMGGLVNG